MQVKASIAVVFLAISSSVIAYTISPLKDAIALKALITNSINSPKALAAFSQTPATSKSWQNAHLVRTLPIQGFSVLSPTDPILATYRRGEQTRSEGDSKITLINQTNENIITLTNINTGEGFVIEKSGEDYMIANHSGQRVILQTIKGNFAPNPYPSFQDVTQVKALVNKLLNQGNLRFTLTGHKDNITDFAFSPNNQLLASASTDKTIKIWDLKTGKLIYTLTGNRARNPKLAISPDSRILASAGTHDGNLNKNSMKLWDLKTGKLIRTIPISGLVSSIRFTSDGKKIVNITTSPFISTQVQVRDANTGKLIYPSPDMGDPKNSTFSIAISPDEKTYAVAGQERSFHIRDLMTGKTITSFGSEELTVDFTADGKSLVTSGREGIKVWQ